MCNIANVKNSESYRVSAQKTEPLTLSIRTASQEYLMKNAVVISQTELEYLMGQKLKLQVSYNGYYSSLPSLGRRFDSSHLLNKLYENRSAIKKPYKKGVIPFKIAGNA